MWNAWALGRHITLAALPGQHCSPVPQPQPSPTCPGPAPPSLCLPPRPPSAQRRLLLGLVASVGLGAFALVPTQQLQISKPSKPLFFYIVPLLRCVWHRKACAAVLCAVHTAREEALPLLAPQALPHRPAAPATARALRHHTAGRKRCWWRLSSWCLRGTCRISRWGWLAGGLGSCSGGSTRLVWQSDRS